MELATGKGVGAAAEEAIAIQFKWVVWVAMVGGVFFSMKSVS